MNFRLLSKTIGLLLLLIGLSMLLCLGYGLFDVNAQGKNAEAVRALAISSAITFAAGLILIVFGRGAGDMIFRKEALAVVGLGWVLSALFGALPYMLCDPPLNFAPAFFESMSGFTTTGSTVIADLTLYPRTILLWRALTQWLGGMGILVLFVAVLSYLGVGSKSVFRHESSAPSGAGFQARIHTTALHLWQIYIALSVICCVGLLALGMSAFDAVAHTFTAISTGGFSPHNESIAYFNSLGIELWITLFMMLGGISFMLYAWLLRGRWSRWKMEEEANLYLALLAGSTIAIALFLMGSQGFSLLPAFRAAGFQVVSIMTTTGYGTADFDQWPPFAKALLLTLMFIGGCAGSTAGGIKVSRVLFFFKITRQELIAAFRPSQVITLRLNGQLPSESLKPQTLFFLSMVGLITAAGTLLVTVFEPTLDLATSFSAVAATLFNIGPGLGAVGPTGNFAELRDVTQLLLSLLMVVGRLELFAILVLFLPSFWRRY